MQKGTVVAVTETKDYTMVVLEDNRIIKTKWAKVDKSLEGKEVIWTTNGDWDPNEWFSSMSVSTTQRKLDEDAIMINDMSKMIHKLKSENSGLLSSINKAVSDRDTAKLKNEAEAIKQAREDKLVKEARKAQSDAEQQKENAYAMMRAAEQAQQNMTGWIFALGSALVISVFIIIGSNT